MENKLMLSIKVDSDTGEHYFDVSDIEHLFENPDDIDHYELSVGNDGVLSFVFFDENKNQIKIKSLDD